MSSALETTTSSEINVLFTQEMSSEDKNKISSAMNAITDPSKRKAVSNLTQRVLSHNHCPNGREQIINAIAVTNLCPQEWDDLLELVNTLAQGVSDGEDVAKILLAIAALPPGERKAITTTANKLMTASMNAQDRVLILNGVAALPSTRERESIIGIITASRIAENMNAQDRVLILDAVAALPVAERITILLNTNPLTTDTMSAQDIVRILAAVGAIPSNLRRRIYLDILNPETLTVEQLLERLRTLPQRVAQENPLPVVDPNELIVDATKLEENATAVLGQLIDKFDARKKFPKIRFQTSAGVDNIGREAGIDGGGVSRTLVTDLMHAFFRPKLSHQRKLSVLETKGGLVPKIEDPSEIKSYRSMGMIFATALNPSKLTLIGNHFNPVLFQMIHALTQAEIDQIPANLTSLADVPQPIQNKLLKLYLRSVLPSLFGASNISADELDRAINDFVDRGVLNDWLRDVNSVDTKEEFLSDYRLNEVLLAALVIGKSMQQCIDEPNDWNFVKGTSPERLQKMVEGSLTKEGVIEALHFAIDNPSIKSFINQWLNAATLQEVENFVFCITGSTTLSAGQRLGIDAISASSNLPTFHTCSYTMECLPRYGSYEQFKAKLEQSIDYVMKGNKIGIR